LGGGGGDDDGKVLKEEKEGSEKKPCISIVDTCFDFDEFSPPFEEYV